MFANSAMPRLMPIYCRPVIRLLMACLVVGGLWVVLALPALAAELKVKDAYVRGLPPGQTVTAAFMTLVNTGDEALVVNSISSSGSQRAEIHTHRHSAGMMSMVKVDSITVPAGGEFVLAPGKHHMMLIGLHKPLREGDEVTMSLSNDLGLLAEFTLPVRSVLNEHKK